MSKQKLGWQCREWLMSTLGVDFRVLPSSHCHHHEPEKPPKENKMSKIVRKKKGEISYPKNDREVKELLEKGLKELLNSDYMIWGHNHREDIYSFNCLYCIAQSKAREILNKLLGEGKEEK